LRQKQNQAQLQQTESSAIATDRIKRKLQQKQNQEQLQQKQNQELIATETESRRADSTRNRIKSDLQQKTESRLRGGL
jgi:hypothetical protein